jgi:hypothetical protein
MGFKKGDKVRMTELAKQRLGTRTRRRDSAVWFNSDTGIVTATSRESRNNLVTVRRDGHQSSQQYHKDFWELVNPIGENNEKTS